MNLNKWTGNKLNRIPLKKQKCSLYKPQWELGLCVKTKSPPFLLALHLLISRKRLSDSGIKWECLTLPEVPWTCQLVGYGTWGPPHSRTPWQSRDGPVITEMRVQRHSFMHSFDIRCGITHTNTHNATCREWSKQRGYRFSIAACPNLAVWVVPSFLLHFPWQGDLKSPQQSASWKKKTLNTDICQVVFSLCNSAGPLPLMTSLAWPWSRSICQSLTSQTQTDCLAEQQAQSGGSGPQVCQDEAGLTLNSDPRYTTQTHVLHWPSAVFCPVCS